MQRCPREYIISLYKSFAPKFDELLVDKLQYRTPALLRESVNTYFQDVTCANFLDLGCGTGLSGLSFKSLIPDGAFIGVDLSPHMLEKANKRNCYTATFCSDVETFTNEQSIRDAAPFSLVVSCDVFVYLGSLDLVFESVKSVKSANGIFAFSVEVRGGAKDRVLHSTITNNPLLFAPHLALHPVPFCDSLLLSLRSLQLLDEGRPMDYFCMNVARFAHKQSYIEKLAHAVGFEVLAVRKSILRKNAGEDVAGLLVVLK